MLKIIKQFIKIHKRVSLAVCVLVIFCFLLSLRLYVNHSASGDEPHYLMISNSLTADHDFDVKNQYQKKDYYRYYPADIQPHVNQRQLTMNQDHWYSFHGPGLPLLTLPAFIIGDKLGVTVGLTMLATLLVVLSWLWVKKVTKSKNAATGSTLIFLSSYFFLGQVGYIYPDLIVSLCYLSALLLFNEIKPGAILKQCLLGVVLGFAVFVHFKTLAFVAPFLLVLTILFWRKYKSLPLWTIGVSLFIILIFFITLHAQFGVWAPNKIYSSNINLGTSPFITIPYMLFDSLRGLFVYNPAFLLLFVGLIPWVKRSPRTVIITTLLLGPSFILLSLFNETHGGDAPTGRYIMTYLPLILPAIGYALIYVKGTVGRTAVLALVSLSLFLTSYAIGTKMPYVGLMSRSPLFEFIEQRSGFAVDYVLPHFALNNELIGEHAIIKVVSMSTLCIALLGYGWILENRETKRTHKTH